MSERNPARRGPVQRLELCWPGKYDAQGRRAPIVRQNPRLQPDTRHRGQEDASWCNRVLLGDNLAALEVLVDDHAGQVDLVYIDPPFATGGEFMVQTRVGEGADGRPPPEVAANAYSDRFDGGVAGFIAMLDPRLRLIDELLAPHGSLYIHVDPTVGHAVKLLADEIFGPDAFQREIVWRIGWVSGFKTKARNWIRNHDLIFFYAKDPRRMTFNKIYVPYPQGYRRRDGSLPRGEGMPIEDVWNAAPAEFELRGRESLDSIQIKSFSTEKTGYATQKNESLLRRIIEASSNPGDLVVDAFCGSGTTLVAAAELGRRFIGCDASAPAVHVATKRLLSAPMSHDLSIETLEPWERERRAEQWAAELQTDPVSAHRSVLLQHHGARPVSGRGPVHGRRSRAAVHVADPGTVVDETRLDDLVAAVRAGGCSTVHVLAEGYDLPLDWAAPEDVDVLALSVRREIADPRVRARRDAALVERPRVRLDIQNLDDAQLVLAIADYGYDHRRRLPADVRKAVRRFGDFVDAWSVSFDADGPAHTPDLVRFRTHNARVLDLRAPPVRLRADRPCQVVMRLWDIMHVAVTVTLRLRPDGNGGSTLVSARQS